MYTAPDGRQYFVFDCHTHIGEAPVFAHYNLPPRFTPDDMARLMAANGVDAVCAFPPVTYGSDYEEANTFNLSEMGAKHQGRILPFVRLNPKRWGNLPRLLERYVGMGAVGVKLHPFADGGYVANDRDLVLPLLEQVRSAGLRVVLVHTGGHWCCTPALVADLALHFKDLQFIIGHSGLHGLHHEAITWARRIENLWLDTAGLELPFFVTQLVRGVGLERVLYGSDAPFGSFRLEIEKVAVHAGLSERETRAILGENLAGLMGVRLPK